MKINFFNPEHVHTLIDLPTTKSIEEVVKLLKGSSSHWINQQRLLRGKFYWDADTELSRSPIHTLKEWRILRDRRSTITRKHSVRSLNCL